MKGFVYVLLGVGFCAVNISGEAGGDDECSGKLDDLVVTWAPPDAQRPLAFDHLPRTTREAVAQNWEMVDDGCKDDSLHHKGSRYNLGDDVSVLILYDGRGHVAGLQTTIPKEAADSGGVVDYKTLPYVYYDTIKGKERYVFTFYFIDPSEVCRGRTGVQFNSEGTMKQLYIKKGPDSYFKPPLTENGVVAENEWTRELCVDTMGLHYLYEFGENMSCPKMIPFFLLYDCGRLMGMGMFAIGNFSAEIRYEYVPEGSLKGGISPVPKCFHEAYSSNSGGVTSMHVFFNKDQSKIKCPK